MGLFSFLDNIVEGIDMLEHMATKASDTLEKSADKVENMSKRIDSQVGMAADKVGQASTAFDAKVGSVAGKVEQASQKIDISAAAVTSKLPPAQNRNGQGAPQAAPTATSQAPNSPNSTQTQPSRRSIDGFRPSPAQRRSLGVPPRGVEKLD